MSVSDNEDQTTDVIQAAGESPNSESWLAEQVRLITLEEGFAL
jgi:hypothetical protein